jgi:hypothetical protein
VGNKVERIIQSAGTTTAIETDLDYYIDEIEKPAGVDSGTSLPGSGNENDLFYKTDEDKLYVYRGSWWLANTINEFAVFVDNVKVPATLRDSNGKAVIVLNTPAPDASEIRYELNLNDDGADAWKNADGTDLLADANDIIEWDGSSWHIVFDASQTSDITYITNLYTNQQYYWNGFYWHLSIDGYYKNGSWSLLL